MKLDWLSYVFAFVLGVSALAVVVQHPDLLTPTPKQYVTTDPGFSEPLAFKDEMVFHAAPTVRKMLGAAGACSAVVVAPGLALTAKHCQIIMGDVADTEATVDGHSIAGMRVYSKKDVMLISAPGLACPCAKLDDAPAALGEDVASIGYPMALARVVAIGMSQGQTVYDRETYTIHTAYSGPGMSGGGLFVQRDGVARLVALTSKGADGIFALSVDVSWMRPEHLVMKGERK